MPTKHSSRFKTFPCNVLVADEEPVGCYGAKDWVEKTITGATVFSSFDFPSMNRVLKSQRIDILIYGLKMNDDNAYETVRRVRYTNPGMKILIFSKYPEHLYASRFLKAGANFYLNKSSSHNCFINALRHLLANEQSYPSPGKSQLTAQSRLLSSLSNRELEIAKLLIQGRKGCEIAELLNIHPSSVGTYRTRVYRKLKVLKLHNLVEDFGEYITRNLVY